jgi:aminoglycoside phosphotransferase (APT) family kinase protein
LIASHVRDRAADWFPEVDRPSLRVTVLANRPKSSLYGVHVRPDGNDPQIFAKVRHDRERPGAVGSTRPEPRPRLHAVPTTAAEYTRLEYSGLRSIEDAFASAEVGFAAAVHPFEALPDDGLLLMAYVRGRTLRDSLLTRARWNRLRSGPADIAMMWRLAGRWLRHFHDVASFPSRPEHQSSRAEASSLCLAYGRYLSDRLRAPDVDDLASTAAALAAQALPERLPLVVGHGDFAPRNVFDADGKVAVFDPMPRWQVPPYEDIGRFLIGLRLVGPQMYTVGAALSRSDIDRREREFLSGYYGDGAVPWPAVRWYQILILLDKWAATVESGRRSRLGRVGLGLANRYARAEAMRLLASLRSVTGRQ